MLVASLFCVASCQNTPEEAPLRYAGSSTIGEHVMSELATAFEAQSDSSFGRIGLEGSGAGLDALAQGEADLAGVSRRLRGDERARRPYYVIIGYDAIAVLVHASNPVTALSADQVSGLFTGRIRRWSELGGADAPVVVIDETQGQKRGTRAAFQTLALRNRPYRDDRVQVDRPRDMVERLNDEPNGVAAVSMTFLAPGTRHVVVDGVSPTPSAILGGRYPFSRPLLLVTQSAPTGALAHFMDFVMSPEGQSIVARKFVAVRRLGDRLQAPVAP